MSKFGDYIRGVREFRKLSDNSYSLRNVAKMSDISPTFLSRIESGAETSTPSNDHMVLLAKVLDVNENVLFAMAGKVSKSLQAIIIEDPELFGELLDKLKSMSRDNVVRAVSKIRDGNWSK